MKTLNQSINNGSLSRATWSNEHKAMSDQRGLIELNNLENPWLVLDKTPSLNNLLNPLLYFLMSLLSRIGNSWEDVLE